MKALAILLLLQGCAFDGTQSFIVAYPKTGHHYGHTYYGIEIKGTVK